MTLRTAPLTLAQANDLIARPHRHHKPVTGHRFSIAVEDETGFRHGAAVVGRPVASKTEQYRTAEVTRLVTDGTPNACSLLYGACARAAKAMGYDKIQTFILQDEPGTSLAAAGWLFEGMTCSKPGTWGNRPGRSVDPLTQGDKQRWSRTFRGDVAA